jgi:UDP-N-acetylglucosamine--N-acetylmuramyl-(pentapeptide) pyrophosphoryl-undecaprenol N-acetylglucosamine transferase
MRLIVAGGGTGGHLFPGIAVAEEWLSRAPENEVLFVGTDKGIEARTLPRLGYTLECISAAGVRGKGTLSKAKGLAMLLYGYAQSREILRRFRPDMVLGVGGYASGPLVMAAKGMQLPCYIHEQNAIPGFTNKVLSRVARRVFVSFDRTLKFFPAEKTVLTGNPLRRQILEQVTAAKKTAGDGRFSLLVFGGSLGAHSINRALMESAALLGERRADLRILHQTGEKDLEEVRAAYAAAGIDARVVPFIDGMAAAYADADLIICRAGATTVAEVTACGKPCIFIPFPHAVDDHQRRNADALINREAGFMFLERELTGQKLAETVLALMDDRPLLERTAAAARELARLDAARRIVDEMLASA